MQANAVATVSRSHLLFSLKDVREAKEELQKRSITGKFALEMADTFRDAFQNVPEQTRKKMLLREVASFRKLAEARAKQENHIFPDFEEALKFSPYDTIRTTVSNVRQGLKKNAMTVQEAKEELAKAEEWLNQIHKTNQENLHYKPLRDLVNKEKALLEKEPQGYIFEDAELASTIPEEVF